MADELLVVDSYSTDDTVAKAQRLGARVIQHEWTNYATQLNWALMNGNIKSDWIMRLDADEYLDDTLASCLKQYLRQAPREVGGFEVNCRIRFMGREIRYGGMAPLWVTRVWRNRWATCEVRWMDEHMVLWKGRVARLPGALVNENLKTLTWWSEKHNGYASREAVDLLDYRYGLGLSDAASTGLNRQARIKRLMKTRLYSRLPLGIRPWLYFGYRSIVRLGVLDGTRGMMFHALQGLWYRLLVDAKVREVEDMMQREGCDVTDAVRHVLGIELAARECASADVSN